MHDEQLIAASWRCWNVPNSFVIHFFGFANDDCDHFCHQPRATLAIVGNEAGVLAAALQWLWSLSAHSGRLNNSGEIPDTVSTMLVADMRRTGSSRFVIRISRHDRALLRLSDWWTKRRARKGLSTKHKPWLHHVCTNAALQLTPTYHGPNGACSGLQTSVFLLG